MRAFKTVVCPVRTPRLVLRAYRLSDAEAVFDAMQSSYEHLNRWMDWVRNGPKTVEEQRTKLRELRRSALAGTGAAYAMLLNDGKTLIGSIGLHPRIGAGALEVGYWIANDHARKGYTSEAATALTKIGFETHNVRRMEIHTSPENFASFGVAKKIGYQHQVIVRHSVLSADSPVRNDTIWAMNRVQYAQSPAAAMDIEFTRRKPR